LAVVAGMKKTNDLKEAVLFIVTQNIHINDISKIHLLIYQTQNHIHIQVIGNLEIQ